MAPHATTGWSRSNVASRAAYESDLHPARRSHSGHMRSAVLALVSAIGLVLALSAGSLAAGAPPVSAQALLTPAGAAAASRAEARVTSFALVMRVFGPDGLAATPALPHPAPGAWLREDRLWYRAPDAWRSEQRFLRRPDGGRDAAPRVALYTQLAVVPLAPTTPANAPPTKAEASFGAPAGTFSALPALRRCFPHPKVIGTGRVAGRATDVLDLGATVCPSNAAGWYNGDVTIWVDQQALLVLKEVIDQTGGTRPALTEEVTSIRYDLPLPAALFTDPAPAGAVRVEQR